MRLLAGAGADWVGLWHGVPGGGAELPPALFADLADYCRAIDGPEAVLVTFLGDARKLAGLTVRTGVPIVQLHAYQPPAVVRALKAAADVVVVKVLHLQGTACAEARFVPAYEKAGTDLFLLDTVAADGKVGSTGHALDPHAALALANRLERPFLLAGGLTDRRSEEQEEIAAHPLFHGIDVDTAARDAGGAFAPAQVTSIAQCWRAPARLLAPVAV
ncbi:hypothetical protein ACQP1P_15600 [Dactylosporangium sp. CA-052675]|uniref:phosphoribosylanthranilate isomerase n=1 Tax=Dactylosporangium sp. CA-052675 TaxID=3239927 RepID=UPI003D90C153